MKRFLIITAVTLFHLLLLVWFLRSRDQQRSNKIDHDSLDHHNQTENVDTSQAPVSTSGQSHSTTGPASDNSTFDLGRYAEPTTSLPTELLQQTVICRSGALIDITGQRILWRKAADQPVAIASMTKLMTSLLLIESVRSNPDISLSTPVNVTRTAAKVGGSQVYLDPRETLTVDELLKCMLVFSANDVAYLTAEYLSEGDVAAFVKRMNQRAREMGLRHTSFTTPHGLPDNGGTSDKSTAIELALLGSYLHTLPEALKWTSTWLSYIRENNSKFKPFMLVNRNRLIRECPGVDGMKTGYTSEAGFCVTATCIRDSRLIVAVVTGCPTAKERNALVSKLLDWGFEQ